MHFVIETAKSEFLILNLRDYPAWRVLLNGSPVTSASERADGLIAFAVPAGDSRIDIAYAATGDMKLGDGISLAALCGALGIFAAGRRHKLSGIISA